MTLTSGLFIGGGCLLGEVALFGQLPTLGNDVWVNRIGALTALFSIATGLIMQLRGFVADVKQREADRQKINELVAENRRQSEKLDLANRKLDQAETQRGAMRTAVEGVSDQATLAASTAVTVAKALAEGGVLIRTPDPDR